MLAFASLDSDISLFLQYYFRLLALFCSAVF